ncbi:methyltransferase domain-containing protein [Romeria aff. gracilis LEGE 07310]|uniref:Methyltransferase domain-containing protein n=1 Tax=Vasconcelosia minhoensis LEGE 07310 TaxID=915328 RepID=A0A8J7AXD4_9CYAN|nr:methyltransferase domain-containing protein [Romeria aff. gracilis LEGE 07310]
MSDKQSLKAQTRAYFDRVAPEIDRWRDRSRYYYRDLERLHQFVIPPGSRVLEIGCGTGELLRAVAPSVGVGVDLSPGMVAIAQQKYPRLQFCCADAETLTSGQLGHPDPFDYIVLSDTLGHLSDIQAVLECLQPFCQPRTRLILTFHNYLWEPLLRLGEAVGLRRPQPPQNWLSMDDVTNLLTITGYRPLKRGRRLLLPKRVPIIADLVNRYLSPLPGIRHLDLINYVIARPPAVADAEQPTCSVIIPARNEAGNVEDAIARMPLLGRHTEVIWVEGHSQDETWATIQQTLQDYRGPLTLRAYQQSGQGKADAVRLGFDKATGDVLMILDADLTVPPEDLTHFWTAITTGHGEFINGSRLVYPRSRQAMPWLNTVANKIFALLFSFLLEQPLKDTLCGTKVLWRSDYERIAAGRSYFGDFDPFGDFDLLFGAAKLNLDLVEVPIRYQPRSYGASNIAHVKEGLVLLRMCAYASRKLKFIP